MLLQVVLVVGEEFVVEVTGHRARARRVARLLRPRHPYYSLLGAGANGGGLPQRALVCARRRRRFFGPGSRRSPLVPARRGPLVGTMRRRLSGEIHRLTFLLPRLDKDRLLCAHAT